MNQHLCPNDTGPNAGPPIGDRGDAGPSPAAVADQGTPSLGIGGRIRGLVRRGQTFGLTVGVAFAIVFLQLGQGILLARLLGPEQRGEYFTAVFYSQLLLYIGLLGGLEVICRYAADTGVDRQGLRRSALWFGLTVGTITMLAVLLCNVVAIPADKRYLVPLACLCSLSVIGQQVMLIVTAIDRGAGNFGRYNAQRIFAAALFPTLILLCTPWVKIDPTVAAILFVVASFLSMAACLIGTERPFTGPSHPPVPQVLRQGRPYFFSMLSTDLFERLDLILVLWLSPLITQGFYAAMVPAVYPLTVIPNTLGMFLFNAGTRDDSRLQVRDVHRILASSLLVQFVTTGVFMLMIGPVVRLLYGEEFSGAVIFALWLAPVAALRGIIQGLDSYLKGRGRPLAPLNGRIVSAVILLVGTWLLFPTLQTLAIPVAALASQVVCLVWLAAIVYADCCHVTPAAH